MNKKTGFTLIEVMVAIIIFAIIAVISYRIITSLVNTKEVAGSAQDKWGDLSLIMSSLGSSWNRVIPLVVRDEDGNALPAVYGKSKLSGRYDAQLEMTLSGYVGDLVQGTQAPKRIGYRFVDNSIYLVIWPVLNRVLTTQPEIDLMVSNVKNFQVEYLYPDRQWRNTWPALGADLSSLPQGIKILFELKSGESIERDFTL